MNRTITFLPLVALLATGVASSQSPAKKASKPQPGLEKTLARAEMHNKRVLLVVNADGEDFGLALKRNRSVSRKLLYEFETTAFPQAVAKEKWAWQADGSGVIVLDASGKEIKRFAAADLAGDAALTNFEPLFCKPVDANQKLADAMADAKKTGRKILVRFDAPW